MPDVTPTEPELGSMTQWPDKGHRAVNSGGQTAQSGESPELESAWRRSDDVDTWALLAQVFAAHPQWSHAQCEALLRRCMMSRAQREGQAETLDAWQRRWSRAHRNELASTLAATTYSSWSARCRAAGIWSFGRCPVPPFIAIAGLLLDSGWAAEPSPTSGSGRVEGLEGRTQRVADRSTCRQPVIVVAPQEALPDFRRYGASRQLLWALEQAGFAWRLWSPWSSAASLDLDATPGVVFWSYGELVHDYLHHATSFEDACRARGVPVVNSVRAGWDTRHSTTLRKWQEAGIPCARFQKFNAVEEIGLRYPLIIRTDGVHVGHGMYRVENRVEAERVMHDARSDYIARATGAVSPPNLAIEFVDVREPDGRYAKYRAYVAGETAILRHRAIGGDWLVNQDSATSTTGIDRSSEHDFDLELIVRAGQATGSDVAALDFSRRSDGRYVFWESNRYFSMVGDRGYLRGLYATKPDAARGRRDRRLGKAIRSLLQQRLEGDLRG